MRKNVFVIIVTFNGDRWIKDTIQSLLKSKYSCRIVVIDNGSICESGSHSELMAQNGLYSRLVEMQFES